MAKSRTMIVTFELFVTSSIGDFFRRIGGSNRVIPRAKRNLIRYSRSLLSAMCSGQDTYRRGAGAKRAPTPSSRITCVRRHILRCRQQGNLLLSLRRTNGPADFPARIGRRTSRPSFVITCIGRTIISPRPRRSVQTAQRHESRHRRLYHDPRTGALRFLNRSGLRRRRRTCHLALDRTSKVLFASRLFFRRFWLRSQSIPRTMAAARIDMHSRIELEFERQQRHRILMWGCVFSG